MPNGSRPHSAQTGSKNTNSDELCRRLEAYQSA